MVHNIRITFGAHAQPQIEIQQGDYNSRTIRARCYTSSGVLMEFEGETVSVVYEISGKISEEYPVEVLENVLTFTMPGISSASAGSGKLQLRIYGEKSLLHSAIIPYTVKASLGPGPAEEDQVPMLVMLVQQAQEAIDNANAASKRANDVANDVQEKLDSGAFIGPKGDTGNTGPKGPPGLNAPQIDDTQITTTNPWSSMQIVNTLCPPFTVSGATVQCTPVANYPLGVQVAITPTQEGTGDPSPENVRPIVGWDAITIHQSNGDQDKTYTVQLGQTVYGGTLDVGTGEGSDEWAFVEFDGSEDEQWRKQVHSSGRVYFLIDITPYGLVSDADRATWKCNRLVPVAYNYSETGLPEYSIGFMSNKVICAIVLENKSTLSVDEFKVWLAENLVTVCYKLATPEPFQATGSQSLPALPGTNTVYTNAGDITVTGASDPVSTIASLQARVSALESAQTNM